MAAPFCCRLTYLLVVAAGTLVAVWAADSPLRADDAPLVAPIPSAQAPGVPVERLTPADVDRLLREARSDFAAGPIVNDERFLRRATLDLIGRQPLADELDAFLKDDAADKRSRVIDRLLASEEFGGNWADYWSDTISYHVPQPELTFLNYDLFKAWLAGEFNRNTRWNEITTKILTASGKVKENPAATFVGFHEANPVRLASETTRVFLGVQIQCAQCHDHPYDDWKREQFHQMAAFFGRTSAKLPWNDSHEIVVSSNKKGEYRMPDAADPRKSGVEMAPAFLTGISADTGMTDDVRRRRLAEFVTSDENPWFAKAYVNRIWARLMGEGFCEPLDDIGENQIHSLPDVHAALAGDFRHSGYDVKGLFRLVMNSHAYQRGPALDAADAAASERMLKLRGNEVFRSLEAAVRLPDVRPPAQKATAAVRFPVPPKSTQETIAETFGYDPARSSDEVMRTMSQALLLMNNKQLHAQVNGKPGSGTVLSKLLAAEKDDKAAFEKLFQIVLARKPTEREVSIALEHVASVDDRVEAFEDLLWSLINSTEFTTRR